MKFKLEVVQDTINFSTTVANFEVDAPDPNLAISMVLRSKEYKAIERARISTVQAVGEIPLYRIKYWES